MDDIIDTGIRLQETVKLLKASGARQYVCSRVFDLARSQWFAASGVLRPVRAVCLLRSHFALISPL